MGLPFPGAVYKLFSRWTCEIYPMGYLKHSIWHIKHTMCNTLCNENAKSSFSWVSWTFEFWIYFSWSIWFFSNHNQNKSHRQRSPLRPFQVNGLEFHGLPADFSVCRYLLENNTGFILTEWKRDEMVPWQEERFCTCTVSVFTQNLDMCSVLCLGEQINTWNRES